ncbi:MAG: hypothetical protein IJA07_08190 [Agathobacter sp.]|nr:hypothetical protein [Agathobacter sp.]
MIQNSFLQKLMKKWEDLTQVKRAGVILCTILALIFVSAIGIAVSVQNKATDASGTENTQGTEAIGTEQFGIIEETEETEMTEEVVETITISMTATSMERDLKIKIVDENNALVTGVPFVITVTLEGTAVGVDYNDHDMDGVIYIQSIEAGKYKVQIHEMAGIVIVNNTISTTVKDKIVYEKVEIENEIKDESQIDSSKEDTANKEVVVEQERQDTLPLLKSTVTTTEVEKEKVNFSPFPDAVVSDEKSIIKVISAEISLPKTVTLYAHGKENSKTIDVPLDIVDVNGEVKEIQWTVDTDDIVDWTVAEDERLVSLTAKSNGQAKLTVTILGEEEQAEISCDVIVDDYTDDKTQLEDMEGNLLFADSEAKKIATPKDFSVAEKFYTNPKYTGWQTLDGKVFYFKEDNTYATGKQVISGVNYEFDEEGCLITKPQIVGIDVSKWQGDIDWKAVAESGIDFAIIRCGYRGASTGTLVEDPYFKKNIEGATKNGIKVGVYFYSQAITQVEAVEEASMALELVKGYHLQLPIFVDTEASGGRGDAISKGDRTQFLKAFCETVKNAGYKPGVYSGKYWYTNKVNASELEQYHIWVAQYNTECTYNGRYDIWQYTDSGTVPGIKGKVDMDIAYRAYY